MDVTIDTVNAEIQRQSSESSAAPAAPTPEQASTETEQPDLSFMTRRERLRARLSTF